MALGAPATAHAKVILDGTPFEPVHVFSSNDQQYTCSGDQFPIFDNTNFGGVSNGGTPPQFTTPGPRCVDSIYTYHWNDGAGDNGPGTIGLGVVSGLGGAGNTLGPWAVTVTPATGNVPADWTATPSPAPVVIDGTYTCQDSNPATWSQNPGLPPSGSDGKGFCKVTGRTAVAVDSTSPNVTLTFPLDGDYVRNAVQFTADASDNVGVDHVDFAYQNTSGDYVVFGSDSAAPYEATLDTTTLADGIYQDYAEAFDAAGNSRQDRESFEVDNTAPTNVALTAPASDSTISGMLHLTATATDAGAMDHVEFQVANSPGSNQFSAIGISAGGGPDFTLDWDTHGRSNGTYGFFIRAFDKGGNVTQSPISNVTIDNPAGNLVTNTDDSGPGSLRAALEFTNSNPGPDTISFDIVGPGTHTISPTNELPAVTDTVTIDGTTQPGYVATPLIEINGSYAGAGASGITLDNGAGGSTVRGLAINRFVASGVSGGGHGIAITADNTTVTGNYVGTDPAGILDFGNGGSGVFIWLANGNTVGGSTPADRNVISGNDGGGVSASQGGVVVQNANNTVIKGNYIGTDSTGNSALGNGFHGVYTQLGATNTLIGGSVPEDRNVISGNGGYGIYVGSPATLVRADWIGTNANATAALGNAAGGIYVDGFNFNAANSEIGTLHGNVISGNGGPGVQIHGPQVGGVQVIGNVIGADATGSDDDLGNAGAGVYVTGAASGVKIGDRGAGGNVLRYNAQGVRVATAATGIRIVGNSVDTNDGLGIDLEPLGPTANDSGDADTGANNLQNFPVLASAASIPNGSVRIQGTFDGKANAVVDLDFYASPSGDPSGFGEGRRWIGWAQVTTNGSGNASVDTGTGLTAPVALGEVVTATATSANPSTSEFSGAVSVTTSSPTPAIDAALAPHDWICLHDWHSGATVTVTIGPYAFTVVADENGNVCTNSHGIELFPGMAIDATDGIASAHLVLAAISVDTVNVTTNVVTGTAPPGVPLDVRVSPLNQGGSVLGELSTVADAAGNWQLDFTGVVDIARGMTVDASTPDEAGSNHTHDDFDLLIPVFSASLNQNSINLWGWAANEQVTITFNGGSPLTVTTNAQGQRWISPQEINRDIVPTDVLVATGDADTKSLTVEDVAVDSVDAAGGNVSGTAPAGETVNVNANDGPTFLGNATAMADASGNWTVHLPSPLTGEWHVSANLADGDGDQTSYDVNLPVVSATINRDFFNTWNWPANDALTVTIDDVTRNVTTNLNGAANLAADIHVGTQIHVTDGNYTKDLTVVAITIDSIDVAGGNVSGTAPANATVEVNGNNGPVHLGQVRTTADATGHWSVHLPFALTGGWGLDASALDEDGDRSNWQRSIPVVNASLTGGGVSGFNWEANEDLTLKIGAAAPRTVTTNANGAFFLFPPQQNVSLAPGTVIEVSDASFDKIVELADLTFTSLDPDSNVASGTAPTGSTVQVCLNNQGTFLGCKSTLANSPWSIDFSPIDVQPGTHGNAEIRDGDGDGTIAERDVAPETTIDAGPSGTSTVDGDVFTFSSPSQNVQFQCSVDSGGFQPCSSPKTVFVASGAHTFQVRAGINGTFDPTPAQRDWTANVPPPAAGSYRADMTTLLDTLDTGGAFTLQAWQILYATCAKLVNYPDAPAPQSLQLVPEVAEAMPVVSADGLTYTFTIRSGFAFANGDPVTAQSFKDALDRDTDPAFGSGAAGYFDDVASVNASGATLTITLTKPNRNLLQRLTTPFACPVPSGTPHSPVDSEPGSGPYTIDVVSPDRVVLKTNPHYGGSRPHAFSEIDVDVGVDPAAAQARVLAGDSDFVNSPPADQTEYLRANYTSQFLLNPQLTFWYLGSNTTRPPFDNPDLRRAISFALDRSAIAAAAPGSNTANDHYLPRGMPGFREGNFFPASGDTTQALQLAALAGVTPTNRITAVLYTCTRPLCTSTAQVIKDNLAAIGIDVEIHAFQRGVQIQKEQAPGEPYDLFFEGWGSDFADPSNTFDTLFKSDGSFNVTHYSSETTDARITEADQAPFDTRYNLWADLDRDLARGDAPAAALLNPNSRDLFSSRMRNRIYNPIFGIDLAALSLTEGAGGFVVNSAADFADANLTDNLCATATGDCTLHAAIQQANATEGTDSITFDIPGSGLHTITPLTPLPPITEAVTIDGYTQPGASENTAPAGDNAVLKIEINGANLATGYNSLLELQSSGSTVRGLVLDGPSLYGIQIDGTGATQNTIAGNFIGTNADGTAANTFRQYGVAIFGSAHGNTVGGTTRADMNLISGETNGGGGAAVSISGSGAFAWEPTRGNVVQGNEIGTTADGTTQISGGTDAGIYLLDGTRDNTISNNVIAFTNGAGVALQDGPDGSTLGNTISANSIYANDGLGIDFGGVIQNDAGDADTGPNDKQNFPQITEADTSHVAGTLSSAPDKTYLVEVFANQSCDSSGYGEGQTFLGSVQATTDASGQASFTLSPAGGVPNGSALTATATEPSGSTSEFSACFQLGPAVQNVSLSVDEGTTNAGASSFALDSIPAQLFPELAGAPNAPAIPNAPIPDGAVGAAPIPDGPIPDGPIPDGPIPDGALSDAPIPDGPIPDGPIPDGGLGGLPIPDGSTNNPLDAVLLSSLPSLDVDALFAGTDKAGQLAQALTLGDIYRAKSTADGTTLLALQRFNQLDVSRLPLPRTLLRGVRTLSYLLGGKTLGQIHLPAGQPWCGAGGALPAAGGSCANVDESKTTLIGLDIMGQLGTMATTAGKLTVGDLAGGLTGTLAGDAYLARIAVLRTTLAQIRLSTLANVNDIVDCSRVNCTSGTIGDAAQIKPTALRPTVRLRELGAAANGLNLKELVNAFIPRSAFPWESESIVGWQGFSGQAQKLQYHLDFDVKCPASGLKLHVLLPFGFLYVPGSTAYEIGAVNPTVVPGADPALSPKTGATWTDLPTICPSSFPLSSVQHVRLNFKGEAGFLLGSLGAAADVSMGGSAASVSNAAPVLVTRNWANALDRSSAPTLPNDTIAVSYIDRAGGTNFFRLPEQGRGKLVTLYLRPPKGHDFDLYVVRPAPASLLVSPIPDGPIPDGPIPDGPIPDGSTSVNRTTDNPPPELLQDGPLPTGQVAVNSITRGDGVEVVTFRQAGNTGYDEIAIAGYDGDHAGQPFTLRASVQDPPGLPPSCPARSFPNGTGTAGQLPIGTASDTQTLALVNRRRMNAMYGQTATDAMLAKLHDVMALPSVNGQVLEVDGNDGVVSAAQAWDQTPCSIDAANAYVKSVNAVVAKYRGTLTNLRNIVIVGDDEQIAFARVPDFVTSASEFDNAGGLYFTTQAGTKGNALYASAAQGYILTDQVYGAFHERQFLGNEFFLSEIALGRLVETPAEIQAQLQLYIDKSGLLDPKTAFVTGFDFMADGAEDVDDALVGRAGAASKVAGTSNTLLQNTWDKSAISPFLTGAAAASDINSWNTHYDQYRLQPAVYGGPADLVTTALLPSPIVTPLFSGSIFFTMGCHAGLNVADILPADDPAKQRDWAQAYSQHGAAVFVGNTGYGYGDYTANALSERLMTLFAQHLSYSGSIGEKLTRAQNEYFGSMGAYGPYDSKALEEATFYGLPFWQLASGPAEPDAAPSSSSLKVRSVTSSTPTQPDPGVSNLAVAPITVTPNLVRHVDETRGTFWTGGSGTVFVRGRSVQPLERRDVTQPGLTAHGFMPSALTTTDVTGLDLYHATPIIDFGLHEPEQKVTNDVFPASFAKVFVSDYLGNRHSTLDVIAGQSRPGSAGRSTERLIVSVSGDVTYPTSGNAYANDFVPPTFSQAGSIVAGGTATFFAQVSDGAPVVRVRTFYTTGGPWSFVNLSPVPGEPGAWQGSAPVGVSTIESGFVAEDAAGNTGWMMGKGLLLTSVAGDTAPPDVVIDRPLPKTYTLNQVDTASYACSDASLVTRCSGTVANSARFDTSAVGPKTFSVQATDNSGNSRTKSVVYSVIYKLSGFFQPISNPPYVNQVTAGQAIPVKFGLGGNQGLSIFASGYPKSARINCDSSAPIDDLVSTLTAGASSLSYDATTDTYTYAWKTDKSWAKTCRQLHVRLVDGTDHVANFTFK